MDGSIRFPSPEEEVGEGALMDISIRAPFCHTPLLERRLVTLGESGGGGGEVGKGGYYPTVLVNQGTHIPNP